MAIRSGYRGEIEGSTDMAVGQERKATLSVRLHPLW
ncbi:hypothetical protein J2X77_002603 [Sphingobacterium sp. 2149]|nr:hypothetical protein [Sphingobacterium sp. 2149]